MRRREDIALRPAGPDEAGRLTSRVWEGGAETPLVVVGEELEAVVAVDGRLVLFVAYGDPYEDSLSIYLVEAWRVLDRAVLGAMGATGRFGGLRLDPPSTILFSFFAGRDWELTLSDRPRLGLPWPAPGLSRPGAWRRWFGLRPAKAGRTL